MSNKKTSADKVELLGKEGDLFKYRVIATGKVFTSRKDIFGAIPTVTKQEIAIQEVNEVIAEETKIKSFSEGLKKKSGDYNKTLGESMVESMKDVNDLAITREDITEQTSKMINKVEQSAAMQQIEHDKKTQRKIFSSAAEGIDTELEINKLERGTRLEKTKFDSIKDAAENLGIDDHRPMWQLKIAEYISAFWFIIWVIIASFTFVPVIVFLKRIRTMVKSTGLAWAFTILFYLAIAFGVYFLIDANSPWGIF